MRSRTMILTVGALLLTAAGVTATESFWSETKTSESSCIQITPLLGKAFKKYDIITVVISESAKASGSGTLDRSMTMDKSAQINEFFRISGGKGGSLLVPALQKDGTSLTPKWSVEGESSDARDGSITRQDKFETRLAAIIREVKPNGNLVIEARTVTTVNDERREISLSGMIQPKDIRAGNTIPSYCIAFAEINYNTDGPASDGARRGWLTKIWDFISPF